MALANIFVGKKIREILPLLKDTTLACMVEVSEPSEVSRKIEEIKKAVSKPNSKGYLIIALKA
jgi:hypothetical protein